MHELLHRFGSALSLLRKNNRYNGTAGKMSKIKTLISEDEHSHLPPSLPHHCSAAFLLWWSGPPFSAETSSQLGYVALQLKGFFPAQLHATTAALSWRFNTVLFQSPLIKQAIISPLSAFLNPLMQVQWGLDHEEREWSAALQMGPHGATYSLLLWKHIAG